MGRNEMSVELGDWGDFCSECTHECGNFVLTEDCSDDCICESCLERGETDEEVDHG